VCSVAVSHDNQWLASGSRDRSVRFWDLHTGEVQLAHTPWSHPFRSVLARLYARDSFLIVQCVHARTRSPACRPEPDKGLLATSGDGPLKICACLALPHWFIQHTHVNADGSSRRELHDASEGAGKHTNISNDNVCFCVTAPLAFVWPFLYLSFTDDSYKLLSG
jgi:WD domain, G-beta repeat